MARRQGNPPGRGRQGRGEAPPLSELINNLIPNQRVERIAKFLKELEGRIDQMKISSSRLRDPLGIDLIEDGAFQAIRALSDNRIKLLAKSVAEGLQASQKEKLNEKRLLYIISQLDEGDIKLLDAYDKRFEANHFAELSPPRAMFGSSEEVLNEHSFFEASVEKLVRLGLLYFSADMDFNKQTPRFNRINGKTEGHHTVSSLGRLVLSRADLEPVSGRR